MIKNATDVQYAYTKRGNMYEKSTKGKSIGTKAGVALWLADGAAEAVIINRNPMLKTGFNSLVNMAKSFINTGNVPFLNNINGTAKKVLNVLSKTKASRAGLVGLMVAGTAALSAAITIGTCRLIGASYDSAVNSKRAKAADKAAENA